MIERQDTSVSELQNELVSANERCVHLVQEVNKLQDTIARLEVGWVL